MGRVRDKKDRLMASAAKLFHQAGFNQTSIADIAQDSGVPLGNVYYYFKTKNDLASAIIEQRQNALKAQAAEWQKNPDPKERLYQLLDFQISMKDKIAKYGCPIGSLCQELDKERQPIAHEADGLLHWILQWVTDQFREMGHKNADSLGVQMVSTLQGICIVSNSLNDPQVVVTELERTKSWVRQM